MVTVPSSQRMIIQKLDKSWLRITKLNFYFSGKREIDNVEKKEKVHWTKA